MFKILHWSDTHHENTCIELTNNLLETTITSDLKILTGDTCAWYFETGYGNVDMEDTCMVLGNHDAIAIAGRDPNNISDNWLVQPSQKQLYNYFFKPFLKYTEIKINENDTWWYKDYPDKNILCIGLNDTVPSQSIANKENEWLKNTLNFAIANNRKVIILKHCLWDNHEIVKCNFTSNQMATEAFYNWNVYTNIYPASVVLYNTINVTKANVVLILCGHAHSDGVALVPINGKKVPMFAIQSTYIDNDYNDTARSINREQAAACANMYVLDDRQNTLKCYRLGADCGANGISRKMIVYDYTAQKFVMEA